MLAGYRGLWPCALVVAMTEDDIIEASATVSSDALGPATFRVSLVVEQSIVESEAVPLLSYAYERFIAVIQKHEMELDGRPLTVHIEGRAVK